MPDVRWRRSLERTCPFFPRRGKRVWLSVAGVQEQGRSEIRHRHRHTHGTVPKSNVQSRLSNCKHGSLSVHSFQKVLFQLQLPIRHHHHRQPTNHLLRPRPSFQVADTVICSN